MKNLFVFLIPALMVIGFHSCKGKKDLTITKIEKLESNSQNQFYLMLRVQKDSESGNLSILAKEKEVIDKTGNPLPVEDNGNMESNFRCQLKDAENNIVFTAKQAAPFQYGELKNEAIVKFIIPLSEAATTATVSYKRAGGSWEEIAREEVNN